MLNNNLSAKTEHTEDSDQWIQGSDRRKPANCKNKYRFWNDLENQIYLSYLKNNYQVIAQKQRRKEIRVFREISKLIKSRTPVQVKSHHQKLMKQYKSVGSIISHLEQMLGQQDFQEKNTSFSQGGQAAYDQFKFQNQFFEKTDSQTQKIVIIIGSKPQYDEQMINLMLIDSQDFTQFHHNHDEWQLQV